MFPQKYSTAVPDIEFDVGTPESTEVRGTTTTYSPTTYTNPARDLDALQAFKYSWLYDSMCTALYNRATKPNQVDQAYVNSGATDKFLREMKTTYGNKLNDAMIDEIRSTKSSADEEHTRKTIAHKLLAEKAWSDHPVMALGAQFVAPENIPLFFTGAGGAVKAGSVAGKFISWLEKGINPAARKAMYASYYAGYGGIQAVPGVAWNYDNPNAIILSASIGGLLGVGLAAGRSPLQVFREAPDFSENAYLKVPGTSGAPNAPNAPNAPKEVRTKKAYAGALSLSDDLRVASNGDRLDEQLLGAAQFGHAADAGSAAAMQDALQAELSIKLKKFEDLIVEKGLANTGLKEHLKQALGMETANTRIPLYQREAAQAEAIAFLGNTYHYNRSVEESKTHFDTLTEKISELKKSLGINETTVNSAFPEALRDEYNDLMQRKYKADLEAYNKAIEDAKTSGADTSKLVKPEPPERYKLPLGAVKRIAKPDINSISPTARKWVESYRESGLAVDLGNMVNKLGAGIREVAVDENYFHTRFSLDRIDEVADDLRYDEYQRALKMVEALEKSAPKRQKFIDDQTVKLSKKKARLDKYKAKAKPDNPVIKEMEAEVEQLTKDIDVLIAEFKRREEFVHKVRTEWVGASNGHWMQQGYRKVFTMLGEQMAEDIKKLTKEDADATKIGAFLMSKYITKIGHDDLKQAIRSTGIENEKRLAELILEVGGDLDIPKEALDSLNLTALVAQATELRTVSNAKLIGEASAFKQRYMWDYSRPSKATGIPLKRLLSGDFLNTVNRNIQEETGRIALSHVHMKDSTGKEFSLDSGLNISRAQDIIRDRLKAQGYSDRAADEVATQTFDALLGRATGETLGPVMQVLTQAAMASQLKNSGIYQSVEAIANTAQEYGMRMCVKHMLPALKMGLGTSKIMKSDGKRIANILAKMAAMDSRVRPDVAVLPDDMTDVTKNAIGRGIMNCAQYQRWINLQAPIQQWQVNMCAGIVDELLEDALSSNNISKLGELASAYSKAEWTMMLQQYAKHGMAINDWDYRIAHKVLQNSFSAISMVALRARRGDRPRFLNTAWGKVCFAYQSFAWKANNALTRRYMNTRGVGSAAMLVARQLPLAVMAAISIQAMDGKDPFADPMALVGKAINATSGLGLMTYIGSFASQDIGGTAPALGFLNTAKRDLINAASGDPIGLAQHFPLISAFLPFRIGIGAIKGISE